MLNFIKKFGIFCFLDNNGYEFDKSYECIAGAGFINSVTVSRSPGLNKLDQFRQSNRDWLFGHISYDVKNEVENAESRNPDGIQFPAIYFFVPEIVFLLKKDGLQIGIANDIYNERKIYDELIVGTPEKKVSKEKKFLFKSRFSKQEYINAVKKLQEHILRGDCYEVNFCQEFYSEDIAIDPLMVYQKLGELSPNPFSAFYKQENKYLICASPERFLKRTGDTIISQPIKGTVRRIKDDAKADEQQREILFKSEKERSENIMIVDLVRNDLSKICEEGSVHVKEFLRVYLFPQVYQMISTIKGKLRENISFEEIFAATFPMGSMTGAPKKRVMELIEEYEKTKRGLFSGTIGYVTPDGDFDFNVVIRSVLYNEFDRYVSIQAGSAITFKSIPENEYEECLLKVEVIKKSLE